MEYTKVDNKLAIPREPSLVSIEQLQRNVDNENANVTRAETRRDAAVAKLEAAVGLGIKTKVQLAQEAELEVAPVDVLEPITP